MSLEGQHNGSSSTATVSKVGSLCGLCVNENKQVEAVKFCVQCEANICRECANTHRKFPAMAHHDLNDQLCKRSSSERSLELKYAEFCEKHEDKKLVSYCRDHSELCCSICVAITHRLCEKVVDLKTAAKGLLSKHDIAAVSKRVEWIQADLESIKCARTEDKIRIEVERGKCENTVKEYRGRLEEELDRMEEEFLAELDERYSQYNIDIVDDIQLCQSKLEDLNDLHSCISVTGSHDEVALFINLKKTEKTLQVAEELKGHVSENVKKHENLQYALDARIETSLASFASFGKFPHPRQQRMGVLLAERDVRSKIDKRTPHITGIDVLRNGHVILADYENNNLKILDKRTGVIQILPVKEGPSDVCLIDDGNAVYVTNDSKIEHVRLHGYDKPEIVFDNIDVGKDCWSVTYGAGKLFVSCGEGQTAELRVYSTTGELLRSIQTDSNGKRLFSKPWNVKVNKDGTRIYVLEGQRVMALDNEFNVVWKFMYLKMSVASCLCSDMDNNLYECGNVSNNVIKIGSSGKMSWEILTEKNGIKFPVAMCYDDINNRLLVSKSGHKSNGMILVYEMD